MVFEVTQTLQAQTLHAQENLLLHTFTFVITQPYCCGGLLTAEYSV